MKVLVIGGTGFMGPHVVRRLWEGGHTVLAFHRGQTNAELPEGIKRIQGDRSDLASFQAEFASFAPQVVLDMIPMTEHDAMSLMSTFKGVAARVVAISSADVYRNYELCRRVVEGPSDSVPLSEDALLRQHLFPYRAQSKGPDEPFYNYEKILVERVVMNDPALPGTTLRLPAVYGPGDRQHRLFFYLKRMIDGRPAILLESGQERWRWTRGYVENVAAAIALAVADERATGRTYNVGEDYALSEEEWIRSIAAELAWTGKVISVDGERMPEKMRARVNWEHHLATDTHRIRNELGYSEHVSFREGLARAVAWEQANQPAEIGLEQFDYGAEDAVLGTLGTG